MASISDVRLRVVLDDAQARFEIAYDARWDAYDRSSGQLYQEHWELHAGTDGDNYGALLIAGRAALEIVRFASCGHDETRRTIAATIPAPDLADGAALRDRHARPVGPFGDSVCSAWSARHTLPHRDRHTRDPAVRSAP
jgi:hypothetical protein